MEPVAPKLVICKQISDHFSVSLLPLRCYNSDHPYGHTGLLVHILLCAVLRRPTTRQTLLRLGRPQTHSPLNIDDCFGRHLETQRNISCLARLRSNRVFQGCGSGSLTCLQCLHGMLSAMFAFGDRHKWRWTRHRLVAPSQYYVASGLQILCVPPRARRKSLWDVAWASLDLWRSFATDSEWAHVVRREEAQILSRDALNPVQDSFFV